MDKFTKRKIFHLISFSSFLMGIVLLHVVMNNPPIEIKWIVDTGIITELVYKYVYFFGIPINTIHVVDIGYLLIGISFFTEFSMAYCLGKK